MNFIQFFADVMGYRVDDSFVHQWEVFKGYAYNISRYGDNGDKYYLDATYDYRDGKILVAEVSDYLNKRAYRWVEPSFKEEYDEWKSFKGHEYDDITDVDGNKYIELSSAEKFCGLAKAIIKGEKYDDKETVEVDLSDSELFSLMKLAHEKDITLNQLVQEILEEHISKREIILDN